MGRDSARIRDLLILILMVMISALIAALVSPSPALNTGDGRELLRT